MCCSKLVCLTQRKSNFCSKQFVIKINVHWMLVGEMNGSLWKVKKFHVNNGLTCLKRWTCFCKMIQKCFCLITLGPWALNKYFSIIIKIGTLVTAFINSADLVLGKSFPIVHWSHSILQYVLYSWNTYPRQLLCRVSHQLTAHFFNSQPSLVCLQDRVTSWLGPNLGPRWLVLYSVESALGSCLTGEVLVLTLCQ